MLELLAIASFSDRRYFRTLYIIFNLNRILDHPNHIIGFDAKRAFCNHSGLGVYSRGLIDYISEHIPKENIVLFTPQKKIWETEIKTITSRFGALWRSAWIYFDMKSSGLTHYHGLAGELPFFLPKEVVKIVTIHDLLFERFPSDYPWIDRLMYRWKAKNACRQADKIIAISEATKNDLIQFYHIPSEKIEVIHNGIDFQDFKPKSELKIQNYAICISSFLPRKNQKLIIEAYEKIGHLVDFDIVFIGYGKELNQIKSIAKASSYSEKFHFKGKVTESEKWEILSQARFSIYPSQYEGFGIPILESWTALCPILLSDQSVHREVGGEAAIYFINNDANSLVEKMQEIAQMTTSDREQWIRKGSERVQLFSRDQVYSQYLDLYS